MVATKSHILTILAVTALAIAGLVAGLLVHGSPVESPTQGSSDLPVQSIEAYEIYSNTAEDLAVRADVVFLGEIIRYDTAVFTIEPDAEDPDKSVTIMDGIVFRPIEVLKGEVPDEVVVGTPVGIRDLSGRLRSRIDQPTAEVVRAAIAGLGTGQSAKTFLVFASPMANADGVYVFYGSGGVVEVLPNGRLASGAAPPFVGRGDGSDSAPSRTWPEVRAAIMAAVGEK